MKFGYQGAFHADERRTTSATTRTCTYRVNNGVPNQFTMDLNPFSTCSSARDTRRCTRRSSGRVGRLTLQGALRYDHAWSYFPEQQVGPVAVPADAARLSGAPTGVIGYNDITPRVGVAYDLFGNGKTSLKVNVGKYLEAATNHNTYSAVAIRPRAWPAARRIGAPPPVTRAWTDANDNFVPDCDLLNPDAQDLRASGGDFCGAAQQPELRQAGLHEQLSIRRSSRAGACVRATGRSASRCSRSCCRASRSRSATTAAGCRTSRSTDNLRVAASRTSIAFSVTAPSDPRLPGGGGYVVSGLYNVSADEVRPDQQLHDVGEQLRRAVRRSTTACWSTSARGTRNGLTVQGGLNIG